MSCTPARGRFGKKSKRIFSLISKIIADDDLVKLIYFTDNEPLSHSFPSGFDKVKELRFKRIYNQVYEPPVDTASVILCIYTAKGNMTNGNINYKSTQINVDIIVHRDLWNIEIDGETIERAYEIADRIELLTNGKYATESLSKDWLDNFSYIPVQSLYSVLRLVYRNED